MSEVAILLGDRPRRREFLIEFLHLIQDRHGHLSAMHLAALAQELRLATVEVYEVATFYAHFDVVKEGEMPPPPQTIRVCDSLTCELLGARDLHTALKQQVDQQVRVVRAPCMGRCDTGPVAEVGHFHVDQAMPATVLAAVEEGKTHPVIPDYETYAAYRADDGYEMLAQCRSGQRDVEALITVLDEAGLKGLGGAGFPTGRKWRLVREQPAPRMLAINADEGEPGTFKDRYYLERQPHRFLEGVLLAAWAIGADRIYIYLRDEYPAVYEILRHEIAELERQSVVAAGLIDLRRGAGAYICGEESAMLESLEGKRGLPRHRPPYAAEVGLFGYPTLIHNVETVYWVREIARRGAQWFSGQGRRGCCGWRSFSVSGHVRKPGVKLAPAGVTCRELIDEYCGGMQDGHRFKGYLPGGASGGLLPASLADLPLDFGTLEEKGCFIGSAAVIVLSDQDRIRDVVLNLLRFFEDESCGQCSPCRVGTEKAVRLLRQPVWDEPLLEELCQVMADASICGLGQAAGNPIRSILKYFREDFLVS